MRLRRVFGLGLALLLFFTVLSSVSSAQMLRPLRWLGQGYGDGFNRCNPRTNSDYYNPYSVHNSTLISRDPNGASMLYDSDFIQGSTQPGTPFAVYAAPQPADADAKSDSEMSTEAGEDTQGPNLPDDKDSADDAKMNKQEEEDESAFIQLQHNQFVPRSQTSPTGFSKAGFESHPIPRSKADNLFNPFGEN